ncbi:MAG: SDR family oxidoreductase [Proteobacteria bacterium]|nr:SDR family oxidoreductase [Pseudomonadota bacterium]MBI3496769.1 SDR family oxidoreductase [Pseudomonadota bacterium]
MARSKKNPEPAPTALAGLNAVVTAGAAGIGRAIASLFADHGARVLVCDVDKPALAVLKRERPEIEGMVADVAKTKDVDRLFSRARTRGRLDILVNNAGVAGPTAPVERISAAEWERTLAVNINGMFYCTRSAVPLIKKAGGGSIINLSSVAGRLGFPLRTPYSASKWAVVGFTKSLAIELGPSRIRVNAIQPGPVAGPRIERVIAAKAKAVGIPYEEQEQIMLKAVSLRRFVTAEDIAETALFLASAAGANISGQAISVCGNTETIS